MTEPLASSDVSDYVERHNLHVLCDVLIQQLLLEKPTDPFAYLADRVRLERGLRAKGKSMAPTI